MTTYALTAEKSTQLDHYDARNAATPPKQDKSDAAIAAYRYR